MDKRKEILKAIAQDVKDDARNFDGKEFNGKNVAEYFGNHGAAIAALANIIVSLLEDEVSVKAYEVADTNKDNAIHIACQGIANIRKMLVDELIDSVKPEEEI